MSLSGRDRRILDEIEHQLASAEPLLARALATGQVPALRRSLLAASTRKRPGAGAGRAVTVAIVACLGSGIAMLTIGLLLGILALVWTGAVMTQISPAALGYFYVATRRARR